jgi:hypothetical protein
MQSKEISHRMGVSAATVEIHVRHLYEKLNARNRAEVVARAYQMRVLLLPLDEISAVAIPSNKGARASHALSRI